MATAATESSSSLPPRKTLKSRLRDGETLYGLFLLSLSPEMAEIAALAGYDFIVVDVEHGPGGIREALACLRAIQAAGAGSVAVVIRVPDNCPTWTKKVLDLGPDGIMFPMIETGKAASDAVLHCRYRPYGVRGCAYGVVRDSKFGFDEGYLRNFDEKLLIMCQIESEEGVKNIQDIIEVEGMDCVMMGPRDLSASLGLLQDPGNPKVREAITRVEKAVLASDPANGGAYLAGMATAQDKPAEQKSRGYHMVLGSADVSLFKQAVVDDVKRFRLAP